MSDNYKVSIITACYNSEKTIERTLKSVLAQTYSNYEYIIIDGMSTDDTLKIIDAYRNAFGSKLKVVSERDSGIYNAMNKGIKMASGELVGIINSDDWYEPDALQTIVYSFNHEKYSVLYGMTYNYLNNKPYQIYMINYECLNKVMIPHPSCFVTRDTYLDLGMYDETYKSSADYDLFLKFYFSRKVSFIPIMKIVSNFSLGGMSSSLVGAIESNEIKHKYKLISSKEYYITSLKLRLKKALLGK